MRTLRLSLTGMVILALLGGPGSVVLAQDDAGSALAVSHEVAVFDGTVPYGLHYDMGTTESVPDEGKVEIRDEGFEVRFEDVSDPRLAGAWRTVINRDVYRDSVSDVWTSAARIDNTEGSWLGHFTGYRDPDDGRWHHHGILRGTGAYEGLTAIVFKVSTGAMSYDVHGMVFPGDLPEAPDIPEPAE